MKMGTPESITISTQTVTGNARVQNGNNYNIFQLRKAPTFDSRRPDILKWLSPLDHQLEHERIQDKSRVADQPNVSDDGQHPGKWLLESDIFDAWRSRKIKKLWYIGMPGAGKTVLASIIISHLLQLQDSLKPSSDSRKIAYLYISYKVCQPIEHLLGSIIQQVVADEEPLPPPLIELWASRDRGDKPATIKGLSDLLRKLSEDRKMHIVIDALDECLPDVRSRLLEEIQRGGDRLSILITSRLLDEFEGISTGFKSTEIRADPSDVDLFIDHQFRTKHRLKSYLKDDSHLIHKVKTAISNACDGMFLLASLQMESLGFELTLGGLREKLRNLPRSIDEMY
ncbi:hypothetical protein K449DRAFT_446114 [Hypoxylon sp. EC38]|nr:hypothetical protein K449DRAFT_446114 [Hypoxylon sp. EC38]